MEISHEKKMTNPSDLQNRSMNTGQKMPLSLQIALGSVMTALVYVATSFFTINIPATGGYFNVGEGFVFISAILLGPWIGGFAGGVGSALADIASGTYAYFAPFTLVAKGLEGIIVGLIYRKLKSLDKSSNAFRGISISFGIIAGFLITFIGRDNIQWLIIGPIFGILICVLTFVLKSKTLMKLYAIIPGGIIMVLTYLISEFYILDMGVGAFVEIPLNTAQLIIGLIIAISVTPIIEKTLPYE